MKNFFESPFKGKIIKDHIQNPNIIAGKYSYYSGYYHGHSFDDCARYLLPDRDDVDKLIIGSYCSIVQVPVSLCVETRGIDTTGFQAFLSFICQK